MKMYFMLIKYTCDSNRKHYPFQSTGRPISHRNEKSFRVNMISRNFVPENSHSLPVPFHSKANPTTPSPLPKRNNIYMIKL